MKFKMTSNFFHISPSLHNWPTYLDRVIGIPIVVKEKKKKIHVVTN